MQFRVRLSVLRFDDWPAFVHFVRSQIRSPRIWFGVAGVLTVVLLLFMPVIQSSRLESDLSFRRAEAESQARAVLAQILAGLFVLWGIFLAHRRLSASETANKLAQDSAHWDRVFSALEQLRADNSSVRLAAIHSLADLAKREESYVAMLRPVLAAYAQELSQRSQPPSSADLREIRAAILGIGSARSAAQPAALPALSSHPPRLDLSGVSLAGVVLNQMDFSDCSFDSADLQGVAFDDVNLQRSTFLNANLTGASFHKGNLRHAAFDQANLANCRMIYTGGPGTRFVGSKMQKSSFAYCGLQEVDFSEVDLRGAELSDCHVQKARFDGSDLRGTSFRASGPDSAALRDELLDLDPGYAPEDGYAEFRSYHYTQGLTFEQLGVARWDETTKLPNYLAKAIREGRAPAPPSRSDE